MIIYVDIDETICVTPDNRDYSQSTPIHENIERINRYYDEGHTIVYWTARGTLTGKSHEDLTRKQFDEWGVKYHSLLFGKPAYDMFICDKAFNSFDFFNNASTQ